MEAREQATFWERYLLESPIKDIEVIDGAARQLITVTTLLQGIYFAAIALSDFKKQVASWQLAVLLIPAVLWLVSLLLAMVTFVPVSRTIPRDSSRQDLVRQKLVEIARKKYRTLRASFYVLLVSMVLLFVNVLIYLSWIPPAAPASTATSVPSVTSTLPVSSPVPVTPTP